MSCAHAASEAQAWVLNETRTTLTEIRVVLSTVPNDAGLARVRLPAQLTRDSISGEQHKDFHAPQGAGQKDVLRRTQRVPAMREQERSMEGNQQGNHGSPLRVLGSARRNPTTTHTHVKQRTQPHTKRLAIHSERDTRAPYTPHTRNQDHPPPRPRPTKPHHTQGDVCCSCGSGERAGCGCTNLTGGVPSHGRYIQVYMCSVDFFQWWCGGLG